MHRGGAVEAYSDKKALFAKKLTPLVIKQQTVGLNGVFNILAGARVLFLKFDNIPKKIESHQQRLSSLPAETVETRAGKKCFADYSLCGRKAHFCRHFRIDIFHAPVKAVFTGKVA
jgi:hypothetical protein